MSTVQLTFGERTIEVKEEYAKKAAKASDLLRKLNNLAKKTLQDPTDENKQVFDSVKKRYDRIMKQIPKEALILN